MRTHTEGDAGEPSVRKGILLPWPESISYSDTGPPPSSARSACRASLRTLDGHAGEDYQRVDDRH
jgi:hypothetical protein